MEKTILKLLGSSMLTRIWHLQTKSFAMHKALQYYYESLDELVDQLAETYLADAKLSVAGIELDIEDYKDAEQVRKHLKELAADLPEAEAYLANIIDEIEALLHKVIYLTTLD